MNGSVLTDHALVRYMERVLKIDIETLKNEIVSENIMKAIETGASSITFNGFRYVISNGKIVTVTEISKPFKSRQPRPKRMQVDHDDVFCD